MNAPVQRDLFSPPPPEGVPADVVALFEQFAFEIIKAGFKSYSARAILHRIRWHHHVRGDVDFKVNNKHSAPLARWFMAKHPTRAGFFETRESRKDRQC